MVRLVPTPQSVRSGIGILLPFLHGRAKVELMGPAVSGLLMREPIRFRDRRRFGQAILMDFAGVDPLRGFHALMYSFAVHTCVDQEMNDVDIFRPEFTRHGLGYRAKPEFRR